MQRKCIRNYTIFLSSSTSTSSYSHDYKNQVSIEFQFHSSYVRNLTQETIPRVLDIFFPGLTSFIVPVPVKVSAVSNAKKGVKTEISQISLCERHNVKEYRAFVPEQFYANFLQKPLPEILSRQRKRS